MLFANYTHKLEDAGKLGDDALVRGFRTLDPAVIIGLFIGGLVPYLFGAMAIRPSARINAVVNERRQFREIKGIMRHRQA